MIEFNSFSDGWIANGGIDGMKVWLLVLFIDGPELGCSPSSQNSFAFVKDVKVVL